MNNSYNKALCTLAFGKEYETMFDRYCKQSWEEFLVGI